jgi:hypothetical protein
VSSSLSARFSDPSRTNQLLWWAQHHPWYANGLWLATGVPAYFLSFTGWWAVLGTALAVVYFLIGFSCLVATLTHRRATLCPGCSFERVTANPDEDVRRKMWQLRYHHWSIDVATVLRHYFGKWGGLAINFILFLGIYLALDFYVYIPVGGHDFPLGLCIVIGLNAVGTMTNMTHNALDVWCPWCRDNGGGDGHPVVESTPDPTMEKTR